jgi:hypothetical protein
MRMCVRQRERMMICSDAGSKERERSRGVSGVGLGLPKGKKQ